MSGYMSALRSGGGGHIGALGDWICVEGDCKQGETLIKQMQAFYTAITAPGFANAPAMVTKYKPSVDAILKSRDALETWSRRWMPFSPNCCAIRDIGGQAQAITLAMSKESGAPAPAAVNVEMGSAPGPVQQAVTAVWDVAKLAALVYGGVWVWQTIETTPRRATTRAR